MTSLGYTGVFTKCVEPIVKRENVASTTILCDKLGERGGCANTHPHSDQVTPLEGETHG